MSNGIKDLKILLDINATYPKFGSPEYEQMVTKAVLLKKPLLVAYTKFVQKEASKDRSADPAMVFLGSMAMNINRDFTKLITSTSKNYPDWISLYNGLVPRGRKIGGKAYKSAFAKGFDAAHGRGTFVRAELNNKKQRASSNLRSKLSRDEKIPRYTELLSARISKLASDYPELRKHLVPLLKQGSIFKYESSTPIDKRVLVRNLNKVLGNVSRGFFNDEHWRGPKRVWDALNKIGITWEQTKNFYDGKMPPQSKTWKFEVEFTSKKGRAAKLYGHMVASGAGSVNDPLSRYDIVVYVG